MNEYETSIIPIIEANYEKFTAVEKVVADFFISNTKEMDFSAKNVAAYLHVSEASLSRFAKKMEYYGYREFIYHYQPTIRVTRPHVEEQSKEVLNAYQELLNKTYSLIREDQVKRIAGLLTKKKRIFVYGFGSSGLAAQEFKLRFLRLGLDVEAITEFHQMIMNEVRVDESSLVIGISLSGATREVVDSMLCAKEKKAATIFVTSYNDNSCQETFDEVVLTAVKRNLEYGNVISPQFPILVIIDIIYAGYLKANTGVIAEKYDTTLWSRIKKYHN